MKVKRYNMNIAERELKSSDIPSMEEVTELDNINIYKVIPLPFGGFIALDPENIHCYKRRIKFKLVSKVLRKPLRFSGFTLID
jgi:hypothetical protein